MPRPPTDPGGIIPEWRARINPNAGRQLIGIGGRYHPGIGGRLAPESALLGRLNAPDGSYGVLYVAQKPFGAFAETFLRTPGRTLIDADLLRARLEPHSDLTLIRLAGPGLAILGATAEVVHEDSPIMFHRPGRKLCLSTP